MATETLNFIDPAELARIADLQLLARTVVKGFLTGLHTGLSSGTSAEFAQYRNYGQGDDPRFIDWRLFARSDRLHIKQFEEETNLRCTLLLDCSASMDYGSTPVSKFRYAQMLAACLCVLLGQQRDAIGFIGYHGEIHSRIPPRANPDQARRILAELQGLQPGGTTDTSGALQFLGDILPPRGMVILISDLLHPTEEMMNQLGSLRGRRHDLLVCQISDPAEQTFPFDRSVTLQDVEEGNEQFVVPDSVREGYLKNRQAHFEHIRSECLASEIDIKEFTTRDPLDHVLKSGKLAFDDRTR